MKLQWGDTEMMRMTKTAMLMAVGLILGAAVEAEAAGKKQEIRLSGVVNLNQATAKELATLPGVGEKTANRIVAYRQKSPFKRPEELVKVKGFGKQSFDKLKPYLTISGPTTIAVQKVEKGEAAKARSAPPRR
jgi:competence protein ComEA